MNKNAAATSTTPTINRCAKCGTPEGRNLGVCSFGGYCTFMDDQPSATVPADDVPFDELSDDDKRHAADGWLGYGG